MHGSIVVVEKSAVSETNAVISFTLLLVDAKKLSEFFIHID
jgi:hypothetical protein